MAFIYSLRHYGRQPALRIVPYYFGFWLVMMGLEFYRYISPTGDPLVHDLHAIVTAIFTVFEFCVFSPLILHYVEGPRRRLAIKLNTGIFLIAEIFVCFRGA